MYPEVAAASAVLGEIPRRRASLRGGPAAKGLSRKSAVAAIPQSRAAKEVEEATANRRAWRTPDRLRGASKLDLDVDVNQCCKDFLDGDFLEKCFGLLILLNLAVIACETDFRARLHDDQSGVGASEVRNWLDLLQMVNHAFLFIYTTECIVRLAVFRKQFFDSRWNVLDLALVGTGLIVFCLESRADTKHGGLLRALRMVRLLRLSRMVISFRELHRMVTGLIHCLTTLFWATMLIILTLTVWSIVAVEYVHPYMEMLAYEQCDWCPHAFDSVLAANITFFQIITGDGWGQLARPIMNEHAWTTMIFVSIIVIVVFGMLNLIVAAVVDTAAQAREADVESMSKFAHEAREEAWNTFRQLCIALDTDNSGDIGLDELKEGLRRNQLLRDYFSVMDIDDDDLAELFKVLDCNSDGDLSYKEFHSEMYKMKTMAVKTQLFFVSRHVQQIQRQLRTQDDLLREVTVSVASRATFEDVLRAQLTELTRSLSAEIAQDIQVHERGARHTPVADAKPVDISFGDLRFQDKGCQVELDAHVSDVPNKEHLCLDMRPRSFTERMEAPDAVWQAQSGTLSRCSKIGEYRPWLLELPPACALISRKHHMASASHQCLNERDVIWEACPHEGPLATIPLMEALQWPTSEACSHIAVSSDSTTKTPATGSSGCGSGCASHNADGSHESSDGFQGHSIVFI